MMEAYCPRCEDFTPLTFDQAYEWKGTDRFARNIVCTRCESTLSILRGDALGAHALQKMAELAHYASPALPSKAEPPCDMVPKPGICLGTLSKLRFG